MRRERGDAVVHGVRPGERRGVGGGVHGVQAHDGRAVGAQLEVGRACDEHASRGRRLARADDEAVAVVHGLHQAAHGPHHVDAVLRAAGQQAHRLEGRVRIGQRVDQAVEVRPHGLVEQRCGRRRELPDVEPGVRALERERHGHGSHRRRDQRAHAKRLRVAGHVEGEALRRMRMRRNRQRHAELRQRRAAVRARVDHHLRQHLRRGVAGVGRVQRDPDAVALPPSRVPVREGDRVRRVQAHRQRVGGLRGRLATRRTRRACGARRRTGADRGRRQHPRGGDAVQDECVLDLHAGVRGVRAARNIAPTSATLHLTAARRPGGRAALMRASPRSPGTSRAPPPRRTCARAGAPRSGRAPPTGSGR